MNHRVFALSIGVAALVEAASLLLFRHSSASMTVLAGLVGVMVVLGLRAPTVGLWVLLLELVIGGKGYLITAPISGFSLSLRLALFVGFVLGFTLRCIGTRALPLAHLRPYRFPLIAFLGALVLAVLIALVRNVPLRDIFLDGNAFLYLALAIPFGLVRRKDAPIIVAILLGGALWVSLKSYVLLAWFAHGPATTLSFVYHWVRDTGIGEISPIYGTMYRIFLQSQIYSLLGAFVALGLIAPRIRGPVRSLLPGALLTAAAAGGVAVSLSRSFWFGAVAGLLAFVLAFPPVRTGSGPLRLVGLMAGTFLLHGFLASWALNFPFPISAGGHGSGSLIAARVTDIGAEPAASSRLELAPVLLREIVQQPVWGYGLAHPVTYTSNDPRVRQSNPSGTFTTYSFEWGYLDQLIKLGLLGTLPFLALWFVLVRRLWRRRSDPLVLGTLAATIALLAVHIFSPYLNHPLGLGWFLLADSVTRET